LTIKSAQHTKASIQPSAISLQIKPFRVLSVN
jgi:hypothetical protein